MNLLELLKNGFIDFLTKMTDYLETLAGNIGLKPLALYIAVAVIAGLIGLWGLHMAKLFSMVGMGGIGYVIGVELFHYLKANAPLLSKMPEAIGYVIGIVLAVLFLVFGWKKCLYVIFTLFAMVGYSLVIKFVSDNAWIAIGGAVVLAMLASFVMKLAFILLTGAAGGFALTAFLGAIYSNVAVLQLGSNKTAIWVAVGISAVMVIFQLCTTRHYNIVKD